MVRSMYILNIMPEEQPTPSPRFLTVKQAAEELNVTENLIRALINNGELKAFQIGGRGIWRIGRVDLENYISTAYETAAQAITDEPAQDH